MEKDKSPRGRNNSKAELKRNATTMALQETLNGFLTQKDKSCDKEERKEREHRERGGVQAILPIAKEEA